MNQYIQYFMYFFMYKLEILLLYKKDSFRKISFQSDEANTDRPLKEFIKNIILSECKDIEDINLEISFENHSNSNRIVIPSKKCCNFSINKVYLPDELTPIIKDRLSKNKNCVYTEPDICLEIIDSTTKNIFYETVELKSTKTDSIPGSSVQQIKPNEWTIFIKHTNNNEFDVSTGQYIYSLNSKMQFPDRSPRPQVSFSEIKNWNQKHRIIKDNEIYYIKDSEELLKYELVSDWQQYLINRWIKMLFSEEPTSNAWFNNCLKKFIVQFLDKYDTLSEKEKNNFKKKNKGI